MKSNLADVQENVPVRLNHNVKLRIVKDPDAHTNPEGKRSLKFEFEIVEPTTVAVDGQEKNISGIKIRRYISVEDGKLGTLAALHKAAGLPLEIEWDENRVPSNISYAGAELWAYVRSKQETRRDGNGQDLVNPNTGEPQVSYQHDIQEFLRK